VARHCSNELKLQLIPLWPVPKFAHQLPFASARAALVDRDKPTNVIKTNGIVRMNASSATPQSMVTLADLIEFQHR